MLLSEGKKKVDDLAEDISKAIINWVKAQTFNITEMEAPIHFPATTIKTQVGRWFGCQVHLLLDGGFTYTRFCY